MRMPLLVPEVVDLIVDELRDDTSALRECALAATVFRSRTRQHLFKNIRLSRCSKQLYASLFSILGNSEMAACVRKLHVHLMDHQKEYNDCAYGKQGIIAILGRLERLEALTLDGVCWSALDNDEQAQLLATTMLPSLRTLHISFFTPPHATFLLKLFKAHQHTLQTVNIQDLKYGPGNVQAPRSAFARATGVRPTEFSWNSCSYDKYLPFSFWSGAFLWTSLVALDLGVDHDSDIQAMQSLLNDVSSTLQHLTFHQTGEPGSSSHIFDLGRLSCLRTFRYEWGSLLIEWPDQTNPLHRLLGLLNTIASPCFEQILFDLADPVPWPGSRDLWLRLGHFMADRKWPPTSRGAHLQMQLHGYFDGWPVFAGIMEARRLEALDYVKFCEDVMCPFVTRGLVEIQNNIGSLDDCYRYSSG